MIFVSLATMHMDFARLVRKMDEIAARTGERVVIQTGLATTLPLHAEHFAFKPREELAALIAESRVVVTHAGIGSVIDVLKAERPLIVVPRLKRYGEHNTDHQLDLAQAVERRGWGRMVIDVAELDALCAAPPPAHRGYAPANTPLIAAVRREWESERSPGP
jgi:beta-1,4-N-acetylglucosaminyltransferase